MPSLSSPKQYVLPEVADLVDLMIWMWGLAELYGNRSQFVLQVMSRQESSCKDCSHGGVWLHSRIHIHIPSLTIHPLGVSYQTARHDLVLFVG